MFTQTHSESHVVANFLYCHHCCCMSLLYELLPVYFKSLMLLLLLSTIIQPRTIIHNQSVYHAQTHSESLVMANVNKHTPRVVLSLICTNILQESCCGYHAQTNSKSSVMANMHKHTPRAVSWLTWMLYSCCCHYRCQWIIVVKTNNLLPCIHVMEALLQDTALCSSTTWAVLSRLRLHQLTFLS